MSTLARCLSVQEWLCCSVTWKTKIPWMRTAEVGTFYLLPAASGLEADHLHWTVTSHSGKYCPSKHGWHSLPALIIWSACVVTWCFSDCLQDVLSDSSRLCQSLDILEAVRRAGVPRLLLVSHGWNGGVTFSASRGSSANRRTAGETSSILSAMSSHSAFGQSIKTTCKIRYCNLG